MPEAVRKEVASNLKMFADDREIKSEMEVLRRQLNRMSTQSRSELVELLEFLSANDAVTLEELDSWLGQYAAHRLSKKQELALAMRPAVDWWVNQGNKVTKTLESQNPTGGDSPAINFVCGEYKNASGQGITPSTARTILKHLGY